MSAADARRDGAACKLPHQTMFLYLMVRSDVAELTPQSYYDYVPQIALLSDGSPRAEEYLRTVDELDRDFDIRMSVGVVDCVAHREFCRGTLKARRLPVVYLQLHEDTPAYPYYGEANASALEEFVTQMQTPLFVEAPSKHDFFQMMDYNKIEEYFIAQGPNKTLLEKKLAGFKGLIVVSYFRADAFKLTAYRGEVTRECTDLHQIVPFVSANRLPIFARVDEKTFSETVQQPGRPGVIFAIDGKNKEQRRFLVRIKRQLVRRLNAGEMDGYVFGWMDRGKFTQFVNQWCAEHEVCAFTLDVAQEPWGYKAVAFEREQLDQEVDLPNVVEQLMSQDWQNPVPHEEAKETRPGTKLLGLKVALATAAVMALGLRLRHKLGSMGQVEVVEERHIRDITEKIRKRLGEKIERRSSRGSEPESYMTPKELD